MVICFLTTLGGSGFLCPFAAAVEAATLYRSERRRLCRGCGFIPSIRQTRSAHRQMPRADRSSSRGTHAAGRRAGVARRRRCSPAVQIVGFTRYILFLIFSLSKRPKLLQT